MSPDPGSHLPDYGDLRSILPAGVSRETRERLERYVALLMEWQARINLVSPGTLDHVWERHIADSAQLLPLAPKAERWVDLGSGGGLPGMVIAILLSDRPGVEVHLIESLGKKAAFLRVAARETGAPTVVHDGRIEAVLPTLEGIEVITARALAPLGRLVELASGHIEKGAVGLFPKGRNVQPELTDTLRSWTIDCDLVPSRTDPDGRIVVVRSARRRQGGTND